MIQSAPSKTKKKIPAEFPARTREHHIADLSLNHVERLVLLEGWTVESKRHDYGYDLVLNTYDYKGDPTYKWGELESGEVLIQLKATDKIKLINAATIISFSVTVKHVKLWHREKMPVILIVYDVPNDQAYWLYTQKYFNSNLFKLNPTQKTISVHIPKSNTLNTAAIKQFREYKEQTLKEIDKAVKLHV